jgi:hypothetical protein
MKAEKKDGSLGVPSLPEMPKPPVLPEAPEVPDPPDLKRLYRYSVKTPCTYAGVYRKQGEVIVLPEKADVPHLVLIE